jgi:hypothetical protein
LALEPRKEEEYKDADEGSRGLFQGNVWAFILPPPGQQPREMSLHEKDRRFAGRDDEVDSGDWSGMIVI